ncbi:MAG: type IV pilus modification protein PilV [Gammaproteobacteria bacterium]|nr:type IV pilus modification protein PilV [Gammaproteobacteria bacterium]
MNAKKFSSSEHHGGFTLVEVLVALVVMAVGMLGIAALYVEGLRAGRTAIYRTAAVSLAADMADRIRANPNAAAGYAGVGPGANNGCVNGPVDCSATQLAQDDWFWWLQSVNDNMPSGTAAAIAVQDLPLTTQYNITVSWPEAGLGTVSYTLAMQF